MIEKKKYMFYLRNGKHITITDIKASNEEKFKSFVESLSKGINSPSVLQINTETDILLIKANQIDAVQIKLADDYKLFEEPMSDNSETSLFDDLNLYNENDITDNNVIEDKIEPVKKSRKTKKIKNIEPESIESLLSIKNEEPIIVHEKEDLFDKIENESLREFIESRGKNTQELIINDDKLINESNNSEIEPEFELPEDDYKFDEEDI